jgi:hypothetical protein
MKTVTVKLIGTNGNVFAIIGAISKALKNAGQTDKANEFTKRAFNAQSYDDVLCLAMEYCEIV